MAETNVSDCLETASSIARVAGEKIRAAFGGQMTIDFKADIDLVTHVDKEVEDYVISALREKYPSHSFLAEESAAAAGSYTLTDEPTWIIDPIDGTTNFVHGMPFVCVSIALAINKKSVCGVIFNPIMDDFFTAERGKGAFLNGKQLQMTKKRESLQQAVVATNTGYDRTPEGIDFFTRNVVNILKKNVRGTRSLGSSATELSWVACGRLDAFYEFGVHPWDIAVALLLIEEAGGVVCDPSGRPLDLLSRRVLGGNEALVKEISSVLDDNHPVHKGL